MTITIKEVTKEELQEYAKIPMWHKVSTILKLEKIKGGLGGIIFEEIEVEPYIKDLGKEEKPLMWEKNFDISNWGFFIAYDDDKPVGGACLVYKTEGVNMLNSREDLSVLWDIRVHPDYKGRGIGSMLLSASKNWSKTRNCKQLKIECQTNNVPACRFYAKNGAILGSIDEYAYYEDYDEEVQLIWYLNIN